MKNVTMLATAAGIMMIALGPHQAMAQTAPASCGPTDPCLDVLPSGVASLEQRFVGVSNSTVTANIDRALNDLNAASTAIANTASLEGLELQQLTTRQVANGDIRSVLNVTSQSVGGDASLNSTAIGNNLSSDVKEIGRISVWQDIVWDPSATANVNIGSVSGALDVAATAVNNNVSITGDFGGATIGQASTRAPAIAVANVRAGSVTGAVDVAGTAIANAINVKGF